MIRTTNVVPLARYRGEGACVCAECNPHAAWLRQQDMAAEMRSNAKGRKRSR